MPGDAQQVRWAEVIDLECGVFDPEALVEHLLAFSADGVAVVAGVDEDVRGQGGEAA